MICPTCGQPAVRDGFCAVHADQFHWADVPRQDWLFYVGTWLTAWLPTLMLLATLAVFVWLVLGGPPPMEAP